MVIVAPRSSDPVRRLPSRDTPNRARVLSITEVPWAVRAAVPWRHVAPAPEDPTIRTVRIIDERGRR